MIAFSSDSVCCDAVRHKSTDDPGHCHQTAGRSSGVGISRCHQTPGESVPMKRSKPDSWTNRFACLLLVFWLFLLRVPWTDAQFVQPGLCETICHCPSGGGVIDCNRQDQLQGVPTNVPPEITKLYIQGGDFPAPAYLTRDNLTGLEHLEHLRVIYCNLRGIEARAFFGMVNLKHLDLSHNSLHRLDAYTFYGLQLVNLYLQEQFSAPPHMSGPSGTRKGLQLADEAFHGLTASQINLRDNGLADLDYTLFSKVTGLDRLILSDNRITHLDDGFAKHFDRSSRLLDLTGNPLECTCKLAWIAARSVDWGSSLPGLNMTCIHHYPYESVLGNKPSDPQHRPVMVLEIRRLTTDQLCPTSRIHHIEVNVFDGAKTAVLDCTAVAIPRRPSHALASGEVTYVPSLLSRSPPSVAWRYVESGHLREVKRLPAASSNTPTGWDALMVPPLEKSAAMVASNFASSTVRLNVSLGPEPREYICTTWDDVQEAEEVVVTLKGPAVREELKNVATPSLKKQQIQTSKSEASDTSRMEHGRKMVASRSNSNLAFDQSNYLFQEQFSLLQMVGAVIGTCLSTIILILIGSRCIHYYQNQLYPTNSPSLNSTGQHLLDRKEASNRLIAANTGPGLVDYRPNGGINLITSSPSLANAYSVNNTNTVTNNISSSPSNPQNELPIISPMAQPYHNPSTRPLLNTSGLDSNQSAAVPLGSISPQLALGSAAGYPIGSEATHQFPIPHQSNLLSPGALRSHMNSGIPANQVSAFSWQSNVPGSPYSLAGSHEYDVPRVLDLPAYFRSSQLQMQPPATPTVVPNMLGNRHSSTMLFNAEFGGSPNGRDIGGGTLNIAASTSGSSAGKNTTA